MRALKTPRVSITYVVTIDLSSLVAPIFSFPVNRQHTFQ